MPENKIEEFQIDQLKEIMNIGASHASTALSQMVNQSVSLTIPFAYIDTVDNIDKYFDKFNEKVSAALINVFGDVSGLMYFLFSYNNERKLVELLLANVNEEDKKDLEESVIKEVGNILAGASLSAFSKFLDMNLLHSVSKVMVGELSEIVKKVSTEVIGDTGTALMFQIDFNIKEKEISTNFMFFIDAIATQKLLDALKLKY